MKGKIGREKRDANENVSICKVRKMTLLLKDLI